MQVLLHTDPNTDGSHLMADHLTLVVKDAMQRFGGRITRVEAHLSDDNGQMKTSADEIHCMLDARLVGLGAALCARARTAGTCARMLGPIGGVE